MNNSIESEGQYKKSELLKKASKQGIKFSVDYGKTDGDFEIVACDKRNLVQDD